ncbi:MAG: GNAT family N-acetyltransferase [Gemmatimonadales bacterium]
MPGHRIRDMTPADAPRVAALLGQLGYPSAAEGVPARLKRMAGERRTIAIVAEAGDSIAGLAAGQIFHAIHADEPVAYLMALVVDETVRGGGVGRALVAHVEAWARAQGAHRVSLPTATHREAAHRFYEHLGYAKTGYRYTRSLE